jgi:hypothetical protein
MGRACSKSEGEEEHIRTGFVGKPEAKRPLGKLRCRWEDNLKKDLREIGCDDTDWINLAHEMDQWRALMNTLMNLRVP